MQYVGFTVRRFRGVKEAQLSLSRGNLILLVGLNESGKTTLLRGVEAFDHRNDPEPERQAAFRTSIRNKSDLASNQPAVVTAEIRLNEPLSERRLRSHLGIRKSDEEYELFADFIATLNQNSTLRLSRVFPFKDGNPQDPVYSFDVEHRFTSETGLASRVGAGIVDLCPFILYFEDFTDRIPEKILANKKSDAFNPDWYDIIDGLFHHTRSSYSIDSFRKLYSTNNRRLDDARSMMKRVNKTLNKVFTRKWQSLSGVKDIEETELIASFQGRKHYFEIKITDTDGTTYSVDERSKGALWYLSFLMKTEFRRKKMRRDSGVPIFLIDEPASNLHSTAQSNMLSDFRRLVGDTSVIYTTHSQYLVSTQNVNNTYVIRREAGVVSATKWGDYIREQAPDVSHYQPLANILQLIPNSLTVPWEKAVLTEGVSDRFTLLTMHRAIRDCEPDFVVYPGTDAHSLGSLISLSLGWQSEFKILLDADKDGEEAKKKYLRKYHLAENQVVLLPKPHPRKIEGCFSEREKRSLYELAFHDAHPAKITKKEFAATMGALSEGGESNLIIDALNKSTVQLFDNLFRQLGF